MEKQTKAKFRSRILKKRDALNSIVRSRDSAIIRHRVLHHPEWEEARTLLTYVSFRSEVDTHKLIQEALAQQKRVVIPVTDPDGKHIHLSELRAYGDLAPGPYLGIFEPASALRKPVDPAEIELAFIPGVVFDRKGGRIGFGGGYFDRLLGSMPNAKRIGLAFSLQVSAKPLPVQEHDIHMNFVVTEKEIIPIA